MKNILLLAHDDAGQEARLQAALDIARATGGHLTCLNVTIMPLISSELYAVSLEAELLRDERQREATNRKRLEARLAHEDVPWTWIDVTGTLAGALDEAAGMADVIVISRKLDSARFPDMRAVASDVILGSGKAVVAVPEAAKGFRTSGRALIAWDGSGEAMKALQLAVPLLKLAGTVAILEIDDGSVKMPAEEAATYLSRHGVQADLVHRPGDRPPAAEIILDEAERSGADYVVMGGFGHGPLVEALIGGASRTMLTKSPVPTLLAH